MVSLTNATTVLGKDATVRVKDGKVFLNDNAEDIIHVIDTILFPPQ
jgi:hypothetical protein